MLASLDFSLPVYRIGLLVSLQCVVSGRFIVQSQREDSPICCMLAFHASAEHELPGLYSRVISHPKRLTVAMTPGRQ